MNDAALIGSEDDVVFSYGTLQLAKVQLAVLGRRVAGWGDRLLGFRLDWVTIIDAEVISVSGSDRHPILRVGEASDAVTGTALRVTSTQLALIDEYEVDDYVREQIVLESGILAWVYASEAIRR